MFKELQKDFNKFQQPKLESEEFDFSLYNSSYILECLSNDGLSDEELYKVIETNYSFILHTVNEIHDINFINKFINTRFVTMFNQVISKVQLTALEKTYCNSLCYDFFTIGSPDQYLISLFAILARTVNKDFLPRLLGLNLPEDIAIYLCVARHSSINESTCVMRLNRVIITYPLSIMTEQVIVDIYSVLYDSISTLFQSTMFDIYSQIDLSMIGKDAGEVYSTISLAILDLLRIMPQDAITTVLRNYAMAYNSLGTGVRFSMYSISVIDYERILYSVEYLKLHEYVIVP